MMIGPLHMHKAGFLMMWLILCITCSADVKFNLHALHIICSCTCMYNAPINIFSQKEGGGDPNSRELGRTPRPGVGN